MPFEKKYQKPFSHISGCKIIGYFWQKADQNLYVVLKNLQNIVGKHVKIKGDTHDAIEKRENKIYSRVLGERSWTMD